MPLDEGRTDGALETNATTTPALSEGQAREQNCYLTTIGRVTGRPHEIEIWFAIDPRKTNTLYLLAGGRDGSDWVRNIRRTPEVRVRVNDVVYAGSGRLVDEPSDEDTLARRVVASKYSSNRANGDLTDWARTSLAVAINLTEMLEKGSRHDSE